MFKTYLIGFIASIVLTFAAYFAVVGDVLHGNELAALLIGLALVQLIIQLVFFLHLGNEEAPRWNLVSLVSTVSIIFILIAGSLWIMNHLSYNMMMTPEEMQEFLLKDSGIMPR